MFWITTPFARNWVWNSNYDKTYKPKCGIILDDNPPDLRSDLSAQRIFLTERGVFGWDGPDAKPTTKNYNQVVAELVALVRNSNRADAGDVIERYLAGQSSGSRYWPDALSFVRINFRRSSVRRQRGHGFEPASATADPKATLGQLPERNDEVS